MLRNKIAKTYNTPQVKKLLQTEVVLCQEINLHESTELI